MLELHTWKMLNALDYIDFNNKLTCYPNQKTE